MPGTASGTSPEGSGMVGHDIIVVGASAGGVEALAALAQGLPADLPAAVCVVIHMPATIESLLASILQRAGRLPAEQARDGLPLQPAHIYVACPDHHLMLAPGYLRVVRGPRENRHRPAVDPLFRSAASIYGPRVIGVVLTGALDDGTAGLLAIKRRGGIAVVQDPAEALFPSMPASAAANVDVDHVRPIAAIPALLADLARRPAADPAAHPASPAMQLEVALTEMDPHVLNGDERAGHPSAYSCPECGGVLWEIDDGGRLLRFRCRVGHAYSLGSMLAGQSDQVEDALWAALKTLEERTSLITRLGERARAGGRTALARRYAEQLAETQRRAQLIEQVLARPGGLEPGIGSLLVEEQTTGEVAQ